MHTSYSFYGYAGDGVHLLAVSLLIVHIIFRKSCQGLSGRMQILYAIIMTTRYFDLIQHYDPMYAATGACYIAASFLTCYLMYGKYSKTLEREFDCLWIETCIISSIALALLYVGKISNPINVFWTFSRYLEATVVIPQIYFDCKSYNKINRVVLVYIFLLICYRALYVYHWVTTDQWNSFLAYPAIAQICVSGLYYFIVLVFPSHKLIPLEVENSSVVEGGTSAAAVEEKASHPQISTICRGLNRQQSLLETPFLTRSQTSSSSLVKLVVDQTGSDSEPSTPSPGVSSRLNPVFGRNGNAVVGGRMSGLTLPVHKSSSLCNLQERENRERY